MNAIERAIATVAPSWAARRARARLAVAQYDAVKLGHRAGSLRASRGDADASSGARTKLAFFARDMVRNTPFATSAQAVIAGAVTGDGIIPKVLVDKRINDTVAGRIKKRGLMWIERHFDTTAIDRRGQLNLYGLQRLVINTVVDAGECLVRLHRDSLVEGCLPFQVEVLEPDYLDATRWGTTADGSEIRQGVEYDAEGQRVAYWIFPQHPGSDSVMHPASGVSMRVPAAEMLHIYRLDRPGQSRGVSWFAPVMLRLQDLADHEDAQLLRQKIAACFAAFRTGGSGEAKTPDTIMPGAIYDLGDSEQISFAAPPGVEAYDEFTRSVLRSVAAGLGITYEDLTGDMAQVNFSSARMGRLKMDQNVSTWQHLMMIPQMMAPLAGLFMDAWQEVDEERLGLDIWAEIKLDWVPPRRVIVDPAREFDAIITAVQGGLMSRQQAVRSFGVDVERLNEELIEDARFCDANSLILRTDARNGVPGAAPPVLKDKEIKDE